MGELESKIEPGSKLNKKWVSWGVKLRWVINLIRNH